jgi:hypothetical protein
MRVPFLHVIDEEHNDVTGGGRPKLGGKVKKDGDPQNSLHPRYRAVYTYIHIVS